MNTWKNIESEFDEKFGGFYFGTDCNKEKQFDWEREGTEKQCICSVNIKLFLKAKLTQHSQDLCEVIEGMKKDVNRLNFNEYHRTKRNPPIEDYTNDGYNSALSDIIKIIKNK